MISRNWFLACVWSLLLASAAETAVAAETPRQEVKRLVGEGAALVAQKGLPAACRILGQPNGEFWHGATYVYVLSMEKRWVCYPIKPALVGQSAAGIVDSTGGDLVAAQIKLAASPAGEGWVEYSWPNPVTHRIQPKDSFVKRVPGTDFIVVSGYYK